MANAAYEILTGYQIGREMRQDAASRKMASGLLDYRQELERQPGAIPTDEDNPSTRLARLQQAETTFYDGLKASGLSIADAASAMEAFNQIKGQYVVSESAQALGGWGTPIGEDALRRTLDAMAPGSVRDVKMETDEDGEAVYLVDFGEDDEDGDAQYVPFDREGFEQLYYAAQEDPRVLLAYDKNANDLQLSYAEAQRDEEAHASDLAAEDALIDQRRSSTDLNEARTEQVRKGKADTTAADGNKAAQSSELANDLMDYPELEEFRAENGGTFDAVFADFYTALKEQNGVAPTRRQVLDAMRATMPTE